MHTHAAGLLSEMKVIPVKLLLAIKKMEAHVWLRIRCILIGFIPYIR